MRKRSRGGDSHKAHIVAADMGYGHERPARSLEHLAVPGEGIIVANNYRGIPKKDKAVWQKSRQFYESMSRLKTIPFVGDLLFDTLVDKGQEVAPFYPRRDLSRPTMQLRQMYTGIRAGLGRHLIESLARNPVPFITTFFYVAFMAEEFDYPGDIWCVTTDADISRAWAPWDPKKSRIDYIVGNGRCAERLKLYGVRKEKIHLTGFPLPPELIGGVDSLILKQDLIRRMCALDPQGIFRSLNAQALDVHLGKGVCPKKKKGSTPHVLFAIGGAGAQEKLAKTILKSLTHQLQRGEIRLTLMAGARPDLGDRLKKEAIRLRLGALLNKTLMIKSYKSRSTYFKQFHQQLHTTDILWTKPSELSFYVGLGIPILMAPTVGSQEEFNRKWIEQVGGGVFMEDPRYAGEWLMDWIASGAFARMCWNGYMSAPTHGTYRIESIVFGEEMPIHALPLIV
ncbi:TPA: hypothetical protein DEB00_01860 [Candidatus Uhrbacteria bacterium]|nr:hypothetical protein [Candidatus Uhrbacteria bacterium]